MRILQLLLLGILLIACRGAGSDSTTAEKLGSSDEISADQKETILFFGNSITAGFGLDEDEAFPGLIQKRIDSLGLAYEVINGGLSGETTASGRTRIDWFLEEKPSIFVLELGGNDGLRGIPLHETKANLKAIIEKVASQYPDTKIVLAGMELPPNMGDDYTRAFRELYKSIASENKALIFIPFLLDGVGGNPELNLPDGIHPTAEGHQIIAETLWPYLEKIL